ncbi:hypothetical protein EAHG_05028 [Escherichia coli B671]|nr:hypothetical protein EAHG_05028 [Escherichia coli B671]
MDEELKDEDSYNVYITAGIPKNEYFFQSLDGNTLHVKKMDPIYQAFIESETLNLKDISPSQIYGYHYYLGHAFRFNDLYELNSLAWKCRNFKLWRKRNLFGVRQRKYNQTKLRIDNRMIALNAVMELYINDVKRNPVDIKVIATYLHSEHWENHPDSFRILRELELVLTSFCDSEGNKHSGELVLAKNGFIPTPKAYATYNDYLLQEQRHRENTALQRNMFLATIFAAVAAGASAIAAFMQVLQVK